jgi:hypothetical protein
MANGKNVTDFGILRLRPGESVSESVAKPDD